MSTYTSHSTQCVTWRCPTHFSACQDSSSVYVSTTDHSPHVVPNCFWLWLLALKDLHCWQVMPLLLCEPPGGRGRTLPCWLAPVKEPDTLMFSFICWIHVLIHTHACNFLIMQLIMVDRIYEKKETWANKQYQLFLWIRTKDMVQ